MTGSNMHLKPDYWEQRSLWGLSGLFDRSYSPPYSLNPVSASRSTCRQLLSWAALLRATLLGIGILYATTSLLGEYHYARGHTEHQVGLAIDELRKAGEVFPLNYLFRKASAIALSNIALHEPDPLWKVAALDESIEALKLDPISPDLLAATITFELDLNKDAEAKAHYQIFRQVAKTSPLNGMVYYGPPKETK